MYDFKTAAVTGATGYLGNVLLKQLAGQKIKVRAIVLPGDDLTPIKNFDNEIKFADITQPEMLKDAFTGCEVVFHLAGLILLEPGHLKPMRAVNVDGTRNVLNAAMAQGVKRFIYTSSIHAFADIKMGVMDESVPVDPDRTFSDYSRTKAEATLLVRQAIAQGLDGVIVYPVGLTGPFDYQQADLTRFIIDFAAGRRHVLPKGGYFFIDVRDTAKLLIVAARTATAGSEFILSREYLTTAQMVKAIKQGGIKGWTVFVPTGVAVKGAKLAKFLSGSARRFSLGTHEAHELAQKYQVSSAKADKFLGKPMIPIQESFIDAVEWLKTQGVIN